MKKNKKIVYIKVEQNICCSLADTMKKALRCSIGRSFPTIESLREKEIFVTL